ncbi:MAG: hypothetical protein QXF26_05240 [Candidatus Bathyarchaeia archaeon]
MSALDRVIKKITYRRLATLMVIVTIIPILIPLGLPLPVDRRSIDFKEQIDKLPPGSKVVWGVEIVGAGDIPVYRPAGKAIAEYLAVRKLKVVVVCMKDIVPSAMEDYFRLAKVEEKYGWKYGEDYVITPFIPGEETAMASFAADVWGTISTDYRGTPLSELPLMRDIHSLKDFDLAISMYGTFTFGEMWARQWPAKYGIPWIVYGLYGTVAAFYGTLCLGNLDLIRGGAEFEYLTGLYGENMSRMDSRNFFGTTLVALIIIGNVSYWAVTGGKRKVGAGFERAFFKKEEFKEESEGGEKR